MNPSTPDQPPAPHPQSDPAQQPRIFDAATIRRIARQHGPKGQVVTAYLKQGILEAKLRWRGRRGFRSNDNTKAVQGYALLKPDEFDIINAVQRWANWRTIPRNLSGRLTSTPVRALDLCSGSGDSTRVLACYLPASSHITGLEIDPRFASMARSKTYTTYDNHPQHVDFGVQSVLEPFLDADSKPIAPQSVDVINVSGAVAVHFDEASTSQLAAHCVHVIKKQGLALIDAGREGAHPSLVRNCFQKQNFTLIQQTKSCIVDMSRQLCFRYDG